MSEDKTYQISRHKTRNLILRIIAIAIGLSIGAAILDLILRGFSPENIIGIMMLLLLFLTLEWSLMRLIGHKEPDMTTILNRATPGDEVYLARSIKHHMGAVYLYAIAFPAMGIWVLLNATDWKDAAVILLFSLVFLWDIKSRYTDIKRAVTKPVILRRDALILDGKELRLKDIKTVISSSLWPNARRDETISIRHTHGKQYIILTAAENKEHPSPQQDKPILADKKQFMDSLANHMEQANIRIRRVGNKKLIEIINLDLQTNH